MMGFPGCIRLLANLQPCCACQVSEFVNEIPKTLRRISVFVTRFSLAINLMPPAKMFEPAGAAPDCLRGPAAGHFALKPANDSICPSRGPEQRVRFDVSNPAAVWRNRPVGGMV